MGCFPAAMDYGKSAKGCCFVRESSTIWHFRKHRARSTLSDANNTRHWTAFESIFYMLIKIPESVDKPSACLELLPHIEEKGTRLLLRERVFKTKSQIVDGHNIQTKTGTRQIAV